ncbi:MAG TPA: hypothetical protein PLC98_18630 [Anaerolineales bacterium]|nr:hypothetical protein [Anaerolineales bacterium]
MTDVAPDPLLGFVEAVQARANAYLSVRPDQYEQLDHLRHVSNRAHWLFYNELVRATVPGAPVMMSRRDSLLLDACTFSHDLGKWIPRDDLATLLPVAVTPTQARLAFGERAKTLLGLSDYEIDLLWLGLRRRLDPEVDAYSAVYDAAHHLVSAYIITADPALGFSALSRDDQTEVLTTVIGHQFGAYYKRTLFELSLNDPEITPGLLVDISRPDRIVGLRLAASFHDADINDMLYVGSLERRPYREDLLHAGGLIKIFLINLTLLVNNVPNGPRDLYDCVRSCSGTVQSVISEFLTPTARSEGQAMRARATEFLDMLSEVDTATGYTRLIQDTTRPPSERLKALRTLTHSKAREFLRQHRD